MAQFVRPKKMLADALDVQTVWQKVPDFKMGEVSLNDFTAALNAADIVSKEHAKNRVERTGLKVNRDDKFRILNDLVLRFRQAVTGVYGFDSALSQQSRGTRSRSRKASGRQPAPAPSAGTPTVTPAPPAAPASGSPQPASSNSGAAGHA